MLLVFCMFIICACNDKKSVHHLIQTIDDENISLVEQGELDKLITGISVIPLETKEECIIANINKLEEKDGNIYVLSVADGGQTFLYRFDDTGRFLNRIGKRGNAQNEYSQITSFFVIGDNVYLLDSNRQKMLRCTREGNCIDAVAMGESLSFIHDATVLKDDKTVLLSYGLNFGEKHALYRLMDIVTGDILWEQTTRYTTCGSIAHAIYPTAVCGENIFLTMPMDKCIYSLNTEKYSMDKVLDVECYGKLIVPETDDYMEAVRTLEGGKNFIKVFGANNLLVMAFSSGAVVWNMEEKRGIRIDNGIDYAECKTIPCIPLMIVSSSDNSFTTCWDSKSLRCCLEMGNIKSVDGDILPDSEEANPVLIRHFLK